MAKPKKKKKSAPKPPVERAIGQFGDGSFGTHLEQEAEMKHKDFPLFLRMGFEEIGERINK
jgi:hypothetical protein